MASVVNDLAPELADAAAVDVESIDRLSVV